jgi:prepilin-type N-terminal cleavage/methylation domain-containing protein
VVRPLLSKARKIRRESAGFTLVELIVVVIIIAVLAVLALPSITEQMRSRRTQNAAKEIANLYRVGRMRAMGRGAATLVRYDAAVDPEGHVEIREAVRAGAVGDPNCARLPVSSCGGSAWLSNGTDNQLIQQFTAANRAEYSGLRTDLTVPNFGPATQLDLCFSPLGRAVFRTDQASAFTPLTSIPVMRVFRLNTSNVPYGLARRVLIQPSGNAMVGEAEAL